MNAKAKIAIDRIIKQYKPQEIILFGSRVSKQHRVDSDYDFIIIKNTRRRFVRRALDLPDVDIEADFFIYTPAEYEKMKKTGNLFLLSALKNHKVLYSKK